MEQWFTSTTNMKNKQNSSMTPSINPKKNIPTHIRGTQIFKLILLIESISMPTNPLIPIIMKMKPFHSHLKKKEKEKLLLLKKTQDFLVDLRN